MKKIEIVFSDMSGSTGRPSPFTHINEGKYPYLAVDENSFFLILFTAPNTGVCLCVQAVGDHYIGEWSNEWFEDEFYPINTNFSIKQRGFLHPELED